MFKDILKENGKWSQGRIYLLISILAYYTTLGIITMSGIKGKADLDVDVFKIVIDALKYAMLLFGGYVFGGKFIDVAKLLVGSKEEKPETVSIKK